MYGEIKILKDKIKMDIQINLFWFTNLKIEVLKQMMVIFEHYDIKI